MITFCAAAPKFYYIKLKIKELYLSVLFLVADSFGSRDVFIEIRVGQVGVCSLISFLIILICESIFKPVSDAYLGLVSVLMHFNKL